MPPPSRTDDVIARDDASASEKGRVPPVCRRVLLKDWDSRPDSHPVQETRGGRDDAVGGGGEKRTRRLGARRDRLNGHARRLGQAVDRDPMSRTNPNTASMRMREDATTDGRAKPGRNLRISAAGQSVMDFAMSPVPPMRLPSSRPSPPSQTPSPSSIRCRGRLRLWRRGELPPHGRGRHGCPRWRRTASAPGGIRDMSPTRPAMATSTTMLGRITTSALRVWHTARVGTSRAKTVGGRMCHEAKGGQRAMEAARGLDKHKRKARGLPASDDGVRHGGRRCMETDAVSGRTRHDMACQHFRRFGKDKATMDSAFLAIAFDMKKVCSKTARRTEKWEDALRNGFLYCRSDFTLRTGYLGKILKTSCLKNVETSKGKE